MNRVALTIAAVCAAAGCAVLWVYIQRFQAAAAGGQQIPVLTVKREIGVGERISAADLAVRRLPEAYLEDRHVRATDREAVVGVRVANRLRPDETVLWSDLSTAAAQARNLATLVPPGMRAVSIPATGSSTFAGLLRPGDSVDAMLVTDRGITGERVSMLVAQNLLVLAVGADAGGASSGDRKGGKSRGRDSNVTLAVTMDQAQMLNLAQDHGSVSLVLRNPDDPRVDEIPVVSTETMLRGARVQAAPPAAGARLASNDAPAGAGDSSDAGDRAAGDDDRKADGSAAKGDDGERKNRRRRSKARRGADDDSDERSRARRRDKDKDKDKKDEATDR